MPEPYTVGTLLIVTIGALAWRLKLHGWDMKRERDEARERSQTF
jgi:hypothetical protein